jgi:3-isopropylmalate dehydrogenase
MSKYEIAVIRGDGIGPELIDAALAVLEAVQTPGLRLHYREISAGAGHYRRTGENISAEDIEAVRDADAAIKGPVGLPDVRFPDGTEAGLLGGVLRGGLDLYANLRPIRLLPGVRSRLTAEPGSIDYCIVRENTEGLYASRGKGVGNRWAVSDALIVTRPGTERIVRRAFELAVSRDGAPVDRRSRVTCVDKANVLRSMYLFREIFFEVASGYPQVEAECLYVDAAAQALVMQPEHFDVLVMENLFGDILSDLGGGTIGGISFCPSGNVGDNGAYFEPIHGSAPTIAGKQKANPIGQILAAGMMLDFLGHGAAAAQVRAGVERALAGHAVELAGDGSALGGPGEVARQVIAHLG